MITMVRSAIRFLRFLPPCVPDDVVKAGIDWYPMELVPRVKAKPTPAAPATARAKRNAARSKKFQKEFADHFENCKYADTLLEREIRLTAKASKPGPR